MSAQPERAPAGAKVVPNRIGVEHVAEGEASLRVDDPATDESVAWVPYHGAAEGREAVDAAAAALPGWRARPPGERADLLRRFPEASDVLARHVEAHGDDRFIAYRRLAQQGAGLDDAVLTELAQHDVYETPSPETYGRLALERWERFVAEAQRGPIVILESCFLQNPLTVLLAKHNLAPAPAVAHLQRLATAVRPLDPLLVYLWQPDTRATLEHAAAERPTDWLNFVIGYVTGQAWGRATGQAGFDGMVAFYEMRKMLELDALPRLGIPTLAIKNDDKTIALPAILAYLMEGAP